MIRFAGEVIQYRLYGIIIVIMLIKIMKSIHIYSICDKLRGNF